MSATTPVLTRTWAVGEHYRVTLSIPPIRPGTFAHATCEWDPAMPDRLTAAERADYQRGLAHAIAELTEADHDRR